jgi:hypothetical protein
MKLRFSDGSDGKFQPFQDVIDFADAAIEDRTEQDDVVERLQLCADLLENPDQIGYSRESLDVVNLRRLGRN